ncbi:hypothetical protein TNCV_2289841 [Trichonephila clavipes]|uniref:Uncharacterized protein n=1 Tax=Trichonephila clavipes TaxID=2585209 RepID=A0A8X6RP09_TRICX|nr:hypothetical protein TNCV_2289841 [Trichonephila clavipes]
MASSAKEQKVQVSKCNREFQIGWTEKHDIIRNGHKVVRVLCSGIVRNLEERDFEDYLEQLEGGWLSVDGDDE